MTDPNALEEHSLNLSFQRFRAHIVLKVISLNPPILQPPSPAKRNLSQQHHPNRLSNNAVASILAPGVHLDPRHFIVQWLLWHNFNFLDLHLRLPATDRELLDLAPHSSNHRWSYALDGLVGDEFANDRTSGSELAHDVLLVVEVASLDGNDGGSETQPSVWGNRADERDGGERELSKIAVQVAREPIAGADADSKGDGIVRLGLGRGRSGATYALAATKNCRHGYAHPLLAKHAAQISQFGKVHAANQKRGPSQDTAVPWVNAFHLDLRQVHVDIRTC